MGMECFQISYVITCGGSAYTFAVEPQRPEYHNGEQYLIKICGLGRNRNPLDTATNQKECEQETRNVAHLESGQTYPHAIFPLAWSCKLDQTFKKPLQNLAWILEKRVHPEKEIKDLVLNKEMTLRSQKNFLCNVYGALYFLHSHNICNETPQSFFLHSRTLCATSARSNSAPLVACSRKTQVLLTMGKNKVRSFGHMPQRFTFGKYFSREVHRK